MFKKFGIAVAVLLMNFTALNAMEQNMQTSSKEDSQLYSGGFTTGFSLTTLAGGVLDFGYYGSCWLVDVGASYNHFHHNHHTTNVLGHLGLRNRVYQNLFVNYGAMGLGRFRSKNDNGWATGAFFGFDYQLSRHCMLSGKVYPYNYQHKSIHQVFANSTLSIRYVY